MKVRWGLVLAAAAIPVALWMAPAAIGGTSKSAGGGAGAGFAARVAGPVAQWAKRSPGERGLGALLSSKPWRAPTSGPGAPTQRVLPTIRDRPTPGPILGAGPANLAGPPAIPPETVPTPVDFVPAVPVGPQPIGGPVWPAYYGPSLSPGGGPGGPFPGSPPVVPGEPGAPDVPVVPGVPEVPGGPEVPVVPVIPGVPVTPVFPGGPGDGPSTPPTPPLPPSAVPEPATWLMMIVGFFSIGLSIRRARLRPAPAWRRRDPR